MGSLYVSSRVAVCGVGVVRLLSGKPAVCRVGALGEVVRFGVRFRGGLPGRCLGVLRVPFWLFGLGLAFVWFACLVGFPGWFRGSLANRFITFLHKLLMGAKFPPISIYKPMIHKAF